MGKLRPFGINYEGDICYIKLRFHPSKWKSLNISKHIGTRRLTSNGYVLFETTLYTQSREYAELRQKLQFDTAS